MASGGGAERTRSILSTVDDSSMSLIGELEPWYDYERSFGLGSVRQVSYEDRRRAFLTRSSFDRQLFTESNVDLIDRVLRTIAAEDLSEFLCARRVSRCRPRKPFTVHDRDLVHRHLPIVGRSYLVGEDLA